jgi:hypothetical protein
MPLGFQPNRSRGNLHQEAAAGGFLTPYTNQRWNDQCSLIGLTPVQEQWHTSAIFSLYLLTPYLQREFHFVFSLQFQFHLFMKSDEGIDFHDGTSVIMMVKIQLRIVQWLCKDLYIQTSTHSDEVGEWVVISFACEAGWFSDPAWKGDEEKNPCPWWQNLD